MHRFYAPDIATTGELPPDEAAHAVRVLRLREGDELEAIDGRGTIYRCRISQASPKRCALEVLSSHFEPTHWGCRIVVAIAPTKMMERLEWMAEKCTEVGIDRIIPIRCHNSERTTVKTERLERIVIAAMKQSLKAVKPVIDPMTPIADVIAMPFTGRRYIAYCDPTLPRSARRSLAQAYLAALTTPSATQPDPAAQPDPAVLTPSLAPSDQSDQSDYSDYSDYSDQLAAPAAAPAAASHDTLILIGPEGDFSPEEVQAARSAGFTPVTLGPSRLRTETAALAATLTIHALLQSLRP